MVLTLRPLSTQSGPLFEQRPDFAKLARKERGEEHVVDPDGIAFAILVLGSSIWLLTTGRHYLRKTGALRSRRFGSNLKGSKTTVISKKTPSLFPALGTCALICGSFGLVVFCVVLVEALGLHHR